MNRALILLLLVTGLVTGLAQAEIYKTINADGEVIYTDKPSPQGKKVELPGLSTYAPPADVVQPIPRVRRGAQAGSPYDEFSIQEPRNRAIIRNNLGIVDVTVALKPALKEKDRHRIQYIVDKELYGPAMTQTTIRISNLVRGRHTLSANLVDGRNNVLASTSTVTFNVRRHSVLHKKGDVIDDNLPEGDLKDINDQNLVNPNYRTLNPNIRTPNPNIRTPNPNILSPNPNVITRPRAQ